MISVVTGYTWRNHFPTDVRHQNANCRHTLSTHRIHGYPLRDHIHVIAKRPQAEQVNNRDLNHHQQNTITLHNNITAHNIHIIISYTSDNQLVKAQPPRTTPFSTTETIYLNTTNQVTLIQISKYNMS